jgi:hypothetical protein
MNLLRVQVDHEVSVHRRIIWLTFLKIQNDDARFCFQFFGLWLHYSVYMLY